MHELIVSPYPGGYIVVKAGNEGGLRVSRARYYELVQAPSDSHIPDWLVDAVLAGWGADLRNHLVGDAICIRPETRYGYARATYELNLGCNYDCEHCYLGEKRFAGLDWPGRERLLRLMAEAGVLWIQLTGGEPLIDPLFSETHTLAFDLGMMIQISTNGSRLHRPQLLELLTTRRPYRVTVSIYGATPESYDGLTRRRGAFDRFMKGLRGARDAGLPLRFNIVVTNHNAHELNAMKALADSMEGQHFVYSNISPTIYGGGDVFSSQSAQHLKKERKPYQGCNAGLTHFHSDPHGIASICKVARDAPDTVDLMTHGLAGLRRLEEASERLLTRHGGCTGCTLQGTCGTCMPLADLYRKAQAPLRAFCQHGEEV